MKRIETQGERYKSQEIINPKKSEYMKYKFFIFFLIFILLFIFSILNSLKCESAELKTKLRHANLQVEIETLQLQQEAGDKKTFNSSNRK